MAYRALEECVCNQQAVVVYHNSLCSYLQILGASAFRPHFPSAEPVRHVCHTMSHLLLGKRGLWSMLSTAAVDKTFFSMFVGTTTFCSNFPQDMCVLLKLQLKAPVLEMFTPKLQRASTGRLFLL